jgi:hypothetical protein
VTPPGGFAVRHLFPLFALALIGCAPLFDIEGNAKADLAVVKAEELQVYANAYSTRSDGKKLDTLDDLAAYSEDGEKGLLDPWGQRYQFQYVTDPETGSERIVIWTVDPQSGRTIAAPQHLAPLLAPPN